MHTHSRTPLIINTDTWHSKSHYILSFKIGEFYLFTISTRQCSCNFYISTSTYLFQICSKILIKISLLSKMNDLERGETVCDVLFSVLKAFQVSVCESSGSFANIYRFNEVFSELQSALRHTDTQPRQDSSIETQLSQKLQVSNYQLLCFSTPQSWNINL